MKLLLSSCALLSFLALMTAEAKEVPIRVVVAIRYLQKNGVSHSHLDLFDGNGRFLRRLTRDESGQNFGPVFSPKGSSVVYQRKKGETSEWRMVSVDGDSDKALAGPPDWYAKMSEEPDQLDSESESAQPVSSDQTGTTEKSGDVEYKAPSGRFSVTLREKRGEPGADSESVRKQFFLRTKDVAADVLVESLSVFAPVGGAGEDSSWSGPLPSGKVPHEREASTFGGGDESMLFLRNNPFVEQKALQVVFFEQVINSTYREKLFALELKTQRLFELSPNGGEIVPLPGMPRFAVVCDQLYLPFFNGRTVNCSYLDLWDADMQQIRFGKPKPAICYGACILTGEKNGRVISLRGRRP